MPLDLNCPKCNQVFPIAEARHPVGVQCPGCEIDLTAEFRKVPPPVAPGTSPYELLVSVGRPVGSPPALPGGGKKLRLDDDAPQRGGGSMAVVLIAGIGALLITLGGLGATGYFLFTNLDTSDAALNSMGHHPGGGVNSPGGNSAGKGGTLPGGGKVVIPGIPGGGPAAPPKHKDSFDLKPVRGALPVISPPSIEANTAKTILLPGKAEAVAIGGGGRYIVMHFPQPGRLAVFDANTGAIEHETQTEAGIAQLAAGANKLVMSIPNSRKMFRVYSLPGLKQENEFECPLFHGAKAAAMGSRTNGPLLLADVVGNVVLVDIRTGKPIEGSDLQLGIPTGQLRASADGNLYVAGGDYHAEHKFQILDESAKKWRKREPDIVAAYPGPDAREVFGKNQIIDANGNKLAGKGATTAPNVWYVPALTATGDYFLKVNQLIMGKWPQEKKSISIAVHKGTRNVDKPVLSAWEWLPETEGFFGAFNEPVAFDQHLFLIPEAKLLVILNKDKSKLIVRRILI